VQLAPATPVFGTIATRFNDAGVTKTAFGFDAARLSARIPAEQAVKRCMRREAGFTPG
jgi:hypothetical protein